MVFSTEWQDSDFVLVFHGEVGYCEVIHGWDALLAEIRREYTVNEDEHEELLERLNDLDAWTLDDQVPNAPWHYSEDTGEIGSMVIYRVLKTYKGKP